MKITNKYSLPLAFVRAVENDSYNKGDADFSVTQLLSPARLEALKEKHRDELTEDCKDRVWSLLGQSVHGILERSARPGDLVEKRFFAEFNGVKISGQIDLLDQEGVLSDWKVTKAWAFSKKGGSGKKPEWVAQLNMQLELLRQNGLDAKALQIVGILKDFDAKKSGENGYPALEIVQAEIPMWEREKTQVFIKDRIVAHMFANKDQLPKCTSAETWGGNRCQGYCPVAKFCSQYQESRKTGLIE